MNTQDCSTWNIFLSDLKSTKGLTPLGIAAIRAGVRHYKMGVFGIYFFYKLAFRNFYDQLAFMSKEKEVWKASNIENAANIGIIEFEVKGEFHNFYILDNGERLVFGGCCNTGFMESGFYKKDNCFSLDENLQTLLSELETYYRDGAEYTGDDFIFNERM